MKEHIKGITETKMNSEEIIILTEKSICTSSQLLETVDRNYDWYN